MEFSLDQCKPISESHSIIKSQNPIPKLTADQQYSSINIRYIYWILSARDPGFKSVLLQGMIGDRIAMSDKTLMTMFDDATWRH